MRVTHAGRTYELVPEEHSWKVTTIWVREEGDNVGEEYHHNTVYPGRFDQALRSLDRMLRDGLEPDADFNDAVATVAHLYRVIGDAAFDQGWLRKVGI